MQYAIDDPALRILMLDTMSKDRHGGDFDERLADWLDAELTASPRPTLLAMHHPPAPSGIDWLTTDTDEPWVIRLRTLVEKHHANIVGILAGHYHRPMMTAWPYATIFVCPSVAPRVALDLRPMDADHPDNRAMIVDEPPSFALRRWADGALTSHIGVAAEYTVFARHDERTKALFAGLLAERHGTPSHAAAQSVRI